MNTNEQYTTDFLNTYFPNAWFQRLWDSKTIAKPADYREWSIQRFNYQNFLKWNMTHEGIYFSVNEFNKCTKDCARPCKIHRRLEENVSKLRAMYIDWDVAKWEDNKADTAISEKKKEVLEIINNLKYKPNLIIDTRNGLQPLWLLEDIEITDTTKTLYKRVCNGMVDLARSKGCTPDKLRHITQILRVPGLSHNKTGPYYCKYTHYHDNLVSLQDLAVEYPFTEETHYIQVNPQPSLTDGIDIARIVEKVLTDPRVKAPDGDSIQFGGIGENRKILTMRNGILTETGACLGKRGDGQYVFSDSAELPWVGNAFTYPMQVLEMTVDDTKQWFNDNFGIESPNNTQTTQATEPSSKVDDINIYTPQEAEVKYTTAMQKYGSGISTGFPLMDSVFKILPPHLYLIHAPTFFGKTTLGLNLMANMSIRHRVLFASLEQGVFVLPRLKQIIDPIPDNFLLMDTSRQITISDLVTRIKQMPVKPEVICIDHLHFLKRKNNNKADEMEQIIQEVQNVAIDLEIPILSVAHTRKINEDRPTDLDDIKDTAGFAQTASVVLSVYRYPVPKEIRLKGGPRLKNAGMIFVQKNRVTGKECGLPFYMYPTGKIILKDDPNFTSLIKAENIT